MGILTLIAAVCSSEDDGLTEYTYQMVCNPHPPYMHLVAYNQLVKYYQPAAGCKISQGRQREGIPSVCKSDTTSHLKMMMMISTGPLTTNCVYCARRNCWQDHYCAMVLDPNLKNEEDVGIQAEVFV